MVSIKKTSFKLIVQLYKEFENQYKITKTVPSDQRKYLKANKKEEWMDTFIWNVETYLKHNDYKSYFNSLRQKQSAWLRKNNNQ